SVLMVKDWSVSHKHSHEPTNGVVFRYLLCKHEFDLCLFDTLSTSKHYFSCSQISLRTFKQVENSR
ncbi:hypothetical protein F4703DRAFT_1737634, partial [Phycomyces blakesleeanus]